MSGEKSFNSKVEPVRAEVVLDNGAVADCSYDLVDGQLSGDSVVAVVIFDNMQSQLYETTESYYHGGQPSERNHYLNDKLHGPVIRWYPNSQIEYLRYYYAGQPLGASQGWTVDGLRYPNNDPESSERYMDQYDFLAPSITQLIDADQL